MRACSAEIVQQEEALIDAEFFALLNRLIEVSMMGGDRESAQQLTELQKSLLPLTSYGRELQAQSQEVEAAIKDLQAAGQELTREKLLELIIERAKRNPAQRPGQPGPAGAWITSSSSC